MQDRRQNEPLGDVVAGFCEDAERQARKGVASVEQICAMVADAIALMDRDPDRAVLRLRSLPLGDVKNHFSEISYAMAKVLQAPTRRPRRSADD